MRKWIVISLIIIALIVMNTKRVTANPKVAANVEQWRTLAEKYGNLFGIPVNLVLGFIAVETGGNPSLVSSAGAIGLTQVLPTTLPDINQMLGTSYGANDLFTPEISIQCGVAYMQWLFSIFNGDTSLMIRAYNQGPGTIRNDPSKGGDYLLSVTAYYNYINGANI
jgi:soluble lytic murein transglycosylase-like protein